MKISEDELKEEVEALCQSCHNDILHHCKGQMNFACKGQMNFAWLNMQILNEHKRVKWIARAKNLPLPHWKNRAQ